MNKNRFYILDIMRFLAALAVVIYHYSIYFDGAEGLLIKASKYGYLGVDFFFLLSGFVIMASAQNRTAFKFIFARSLRIYPAFLVCLLLTVLTIKYIGGHAIPPIVWLSNATILNDYLGISNIDGVYWTLQAELKFYGCVFLLILFGFFKCWRIWLAIWLAMAILYYFYSQPFFMGWFISPNYSFYFIAGVCANLLFEVDKSIFIKLYFLISSVFGVVVVGEQVGNFIPNPSVENVVFARVIAALFFLFFYSIASGHFNIKQPHWWWAYLGATSYPLYLLHNAMGKTFVSYFSTDINIYLLVPFVIVVILLISLIIHVCIEKPLHSLAKRIVK